jgi:hypothetical protein
MATMNPILRLRRAFRSIDIEEEQADDVAEALTDHSFSRRETELMFQHERALMRQAMAEMRNQILLGTLLIAGILGTILTIAIAVFD